MLTIAKKSIDDPLILPIGARHRCALIAIRKRRTDPLDPGNSFHQG